MADLVQWLRAQLDADTAEIADPYADKAWHARDCESVPDVLYPDRETGACDCGVPARVLREIEMKRSLVAAYADMLTVGPDIEGGYKRPIREALARQAPNFLIVLALPYADRPGFVEAIASVE